MDYHDPLNRFYDKALAEGHSDAQKVGWDSEAAQPLRFEALLQVLRPEDWTPSTRLLDVGCGMGDLIRWLRATGRQVDYTGIDINPAMIDLARERYPGARFKAADLFELNERSDVVLCAGALGVRFGTEADNWRFVRRMYELCERAAAFNLLIHEPIQATSELSTHYWHIDPADAVAAVARLSPRFVLRSDVTPTDVVVYMYKEYAPLMEGAYPRHTPAAYSADVRLHWGEPHLSLALMEDAGEAASPQGQAMNACMRGYALYQLDREDEAVALMAEALRLDPTHFEAGAGLMRIHQGKGRLEEASEVLKRTLAGARPGPQQGDWLRSVLHQGLVDAREWHRAKALEGEAETDAARCLMAGRRLSAEGDLAGAESTLRAAKALRPEDRRADVALAWVHLKAERYGDALELAASVLDDFPKQADARGVALMSLQRLGHLSPEAKLDLLRPLASHKVLGRFIGRMVDPLYSQVVGR